MVVLDVEDDAFTYLGVTSKGSIYWDGYEKLDGLDRDDTIYTRYPEDSSSSSSSGDEELTNGKSVTEKNVMALLEDLMDYELYDLRYVPERYAVEELSVPGFDQLVVAENLDYGGQQLFARLGSRVVCLDYTGSRDLTEHLEQVAALLQWDG